MRRRANFFEGLAEPALMLRKGRYKYIHCNRQTQLLFDVESDPHELRIWPGEPAHAAKLAELGGLVARRWDFDRLTREILLSQRRRNLIQRSVLAGRYPAWDFQPFEDATRVYYRARDGGDWHAAEAARFPAVQVTKDERIPCPVLRTGEGDPSRSDGG